VKYQITMAPWFLNHVGVSYHEHGTITENKVKLFDYYKVDGVTPEQRVKILEWSPKTQFMGSRAQYAPELSATLICFPKSAWFKGQKKYDCILCGKKAPEPACQECEDFVEGLK
jgi:hypothetical protein